MYERFTDRARKVMMLANEEAQRLRHEYIGTEHILLGLVGEGAGVAANVLKSLGVDQETVHLEVEKLISVGQHDVPQQQLPLTPRAKKALEYAMGEAINLRNEYVGTEHLLLGLLREEEGVAAQVLMNCGLRLEQVRNQVLNLLGNDPVPVERINDDWIIDRLTELMTRANRRLTILIGLASVATVLSLVATVLAIVAVANAWMK